MIDKRNLRDYYFSQSKKTNFTNDKIKYKLHIREYQSLNRGKMKEYFASKNMKDFLNLWAQTLWPMTMTVTCLLIILSMIWKDPIWLCPVIFLSVPQPIVSSLFSKLEPSSIPDISAIPSKVLKNTFKPLVPVITKLFNHCISSCRVLNEWNTAVVTALFKRKGDLNDFNGYLGISVLPPIAKNFEKKLAVQNQIFLNTNRILFSGQHGLRSDHSCETTLHELISDLNQIRNKRSIALLFIDFRKAFDLVDSK